MHSMGSMPAMYAPADMTETQTGQYEGVFSPSMSGEWPLSIEIKAGSNTGTITFGLATGRKGLRCSSCTRSATDLPGTVLVNPARRQLIGITTATAQQKNLHLSIRAAGQVSYDESRLNDVTLKFNGWIGKLYANAIGKSVTKGQPLFTVYSPELLSAQEEYLEILRRSSVKTNSHRLNAARRRLRLWGISQTQIKRLEKRGKAQEYMAIRATSSGVVIKKQIVAGSAFQAGQQLLRIADLSQVWVEAQVYDYELPQIKIGMHASVTLHQQQEKHYPTRIDFIYPFMENGSHTTRIRATLPNPNGSLRPEMYATMELKVDLGKRLLIPESAVLYSGENRVVFVDLGDGRLAPRQITMGQRNRDWIEVLSGINAGDTVVTSGTFLIAAESKLKAGIKSW